MIHFHFISSQMEMILVAAITIASFNKNKIWLFNKANDICIHFFVHTLTSGVRSMHVKLIYMSLTPNVNVYKMCTNNTCHLTIALARSSASFAASGN
jgi:hypothetical protein